MSHSVRHAAGDLRVDEAKQRDLREPNVIISCTVISLFTALHAELNKGLQPKMLSSIIYKMFQYNNTKCLLTHTCTQKVDRLIEICDNVLIILIYKKLQ